MSNKTSQNICLTSCCGFLLLVNLTRKELIVSHGVTLFCFQGSSLPSESFTPTMISYLPLQLPVCRQLSQLEARIEICPTFHSPRCSIFWRFSPISRDTNSMARILCSMNMFHSDQQKMNLSCIEWKRYILFLSKIGANKNSERPS